MNGWLRTDMVYYETLEVAKVKQNMLSADKGFAITIHKMQGILPTCSNQRVVQRACMSMLKMQDCLVTTKQITVRVVKTQACVKCKGASNRFRGTSMLNPPEIYPH